MNYIYQNIEITKKLEISETLQKSLFLTFFSSLGTITGLSIAYLYKRPYMFNEIYNEKKERYYYLISGFIGSFIGINYYLNKQ